MSDRAPFSKGSFYGDIDEFENSSIRVMGFFKEKKEKKQPSRAGFWYKNSIPLERKFYLLYFKYKILEGTEIATFWLSNELKKEPRLEKTLSRLLIPARFWRRWRKRKNFAASFLTQLISADVIPPSPFLGWFRPPLWGSMSGI